MEMNTSPIKVLILCGGKGERLKEVTGDLSKVMIDIHGQPLMLRLMNHCSDLGFKNFILKTGYGHEQLENYFGNGFYFGVNIEYMRDKTLLGTAGGLNKFKSRKSPIIIMYGDVLTDINLNKMLKYHYNNHANATIAVRHSDHPEDSDVLTLDSSNRILQSIHKPGNCDYGDITNAACYILEPECFAFIPTGGVKYDFGKDMVPNLLKNNMRVFGYMSNDYFKDIGTSHRLSEAMQDINKGRVKI